MRQHLRLSKPLYQKKEQTNYQPYKLDITKDKSSPDILDDTAILSTVDSKGHPYASVIHFVYGKDESYYLLTKTDTQKAKNIVKNKNVAFTVHPSGSLLVLYIRGTAERVDDKEVHDTIFNTIAAPQDYSEGTKFAPITKIDAGQYIVFKITPKDTKLLDYGTSSW